MKSVKPCLELSCGFVILSSNNIPSVSLEDQFNAVEQQYIDFNIEAASGDMGYG